MKKPTTSTKKGKETHKHRRESKDAHSEAMELLSSEKRWSFSKIAIGIAALAFAIWQPFYFFIILGFFGALIASLVIYSWASDSGNGCLGLIFGFIGFGLVISISTEVASPFKPPLTEKEERDAALSAWRRAKKDHTYYSEQANKAFEEVNVSKYHFWNEQKKDAQERMNRYQNTMHRHQNSMNRDTP